MEEEQSVQAPEKRSPLRLFWHFFKVGFYTFGGGWSIVAQMQKEYAEKRHWITAEDLLDITSVGRSLPGLMIGNVSYLFGYHVAGVPGALACLLGVVLPPLIILTVVTWCYTQVCGNIYVMRAMAGVRAAVVPIIASAAMGLRKGALAEKSGYFIMLLGLGLYLLLGVNCIFIVLLGALIGYTLSTWKERRKGGGGNGTA